MNKMKVIETDGYKNDYVIREEKKKKSKVDILDICMLGVSLGVVIGVAFLIVGLV